MVRLSLTNLRQDEERLLEKRRSTGKDGGFPDACRNGYQVRNSPESR